MGAVMSAERYIKGIRNEAKRAYAVAYLKWIRSGEQGDSPEYVGLSYMAAQAVRLNLRDYEPHAAYNYHAVRK